MARRTLQNCRVIRECVRHGIGTPDQRKGACEGYQRSREDDEPTAVCKRCPLHYINVEEAQAAKLEVMRAAAYSYANVPYSATWPSDP